LTVPDVVDEPVGADDSPRIEGETHEHGTLPGTAGRDRLAVHS
jgi:hypothetical protein